MKRVLIALIALAMASCQDRSEPAAPQPPGTTPATEWTQGPPCEEDKGSCGVPLHPTRTAEGAVIHIPTEPAHVNYITQETGSLTGKQGIRMVYRVNIPEGVEIRATKPRGELYPGMLYMYFERKGNDWTGGPDQNWYRWWAFTGERRLENGTFEVTVRFDEQWGAVNYGGNYCDETTMSNDPDCRGPAQFHTALANAGRIGFTLGGGDGKGHGVHGTGPGAELVILSYEVF